MLVTSSDEVSKVVSFASKRYNPLVVQAGGHNTSGSSSTHGGIVISLSKMRKVLVDPASMTVAVQGGAIWADVDLAAAEHGLAVVGCTANHTGVGGTTLGGGYGWLTGRYGLVIDNLISVQMVLADGSIVIASATEHPDLFWAVRGAGQDFGVVTEFVFRAHPQKTMVFGGLLYFTVDRLSQVVEFANRFEQLTDGNQGCFVGFTAPPLMEHSAIVVMTFYNGPQLEAEKFFAPLLSLDPIVNETGMVPYPKINTMINRAAMFGGRKRFSGTNITLPLDVKFIHEIFEDFDTIMRSYPMAGDSVLAIELVSYTQVIKVSNDATACANRGRYYNVGSVFCWHHAELDGRMRSLQRTLMKKIEERAGIAKGHGSWQQGAGVYANYAGTWFPGHRTAVERRISVIRSMLIFHCSLRASSLTGK